MTPTRTASLGRAAGEVAEAVRRMIESGKISVNKFLPSERALAVEYDVDKKTVRRALKALQNDGLIGAVERHGYRVLSTGAGPGPARPLAYIPPSEENVANLGIPAKLILPALRDAADRRGWSLLAVGSQRSASVIVAEVQQVGVSGIILDNDQPEIVRAVLESGITAVAVDAWMSDVPMDAVIQDGQDAGIQAVRHLLAAGCRRIAWLGPQQVSPHATDRFSGVAAALNDVGRSLTPDLNIRIGGMDLRETLRRVLSGSQRPDGICALWMGLVRDVAGAAREAGLEVGRDVHLVGWAPEEVFDADYRQLFGDGPRPPAVTWSVRAMADTAIARLVERQQNPTLPPVRVRLPMKLMGV